MSSGPWLWSYAALVRFKTAASLARRAVAKATGCRPDGFATALPRPIPKRIWIFWAQGEAAAPQLVRACIDSWRRENPGWEVTVLDADSLTSIVEMPRPQGAMTVQAYSDLVRLALLDRHGGVWADATVFCVTPLDHWLPPVARHGFFAFLWTAADSWFVRPNVHRIMTSWFLASEPGGDVIGPWNARATAYWDGRDTPHDYYWVHLLLEHMALTDRTIGRRFAAMPKLGAYGAHLVHDYVAKGRDCDAIRAALASGAVPVQKLRWNWGPEELARAHEVLPEIPAPGMPEEASGAAPAPLPEAAAHG